MRHLPRCTYAILLIGSVADPLSTQARTLIPIGSGFSNPIGVAVDGNGNVFVADSGNNAVKEVFAAGGYSTINTLGSGFSNPWGLAIDSNGNIFVADYGNNAVKEILATGGYVTVNTLGSGFSNPEGVAVDGNGNVFVADNGNNAVKEILAAGGYTTVNTLGSGFSNPEGVAVDGAGNVFVSDVGNFRVREILAAGGYVTINTLGLGPPPGGFPGAIAVDSSGNVFNGQGYPRNFAGYVVEYLATGYTNFNDFYVGYVAPAGIAVNSNGLFVTSVTFNSVTEIVPATPVTLQGFYVD